MPDLDSISRLTLWTAIAIYALAFIAYAFDLARRSSTVKAEERMLVMSDGTVSQAPVDGDADAPVGKRFVMARIGTSLMVLGWLFHLAATLTRGFANGHVPWANLYEFAMTGTLLVVLVYLVMLTRIDLRYLGTFISGIVLVLLGAASAYFYVEVKPLADPLKSVWLVIHVFVASLSVGIFALAFALSVFGFPIVAVLWMT